MKVTAKRGSSCQDRMVPNMYVRTGLRIRITKPLARSTFIVLTEFDNYNSIVIFWRSNVNLLLAKSYSAHCLDPESNMSAVLFF